MLESKTVFVRASFSILAAAKVNLALEVLEKRPDGYHELETVLQAVDLFDHLRLDKASEISLRVVNRSVPQDSTNLAWRAARLIQETLGIEQGVRITLRKRIPVAAGLGGGSSDAAAVLWGLNQLWGLGKDDEFLRRLAVQLGMDVPFFLGGGTQLATGRGEVLTPLKPAGALTLVLVNPNFPLSTREVYSMVPGRLLDDGSRVRALVAALETGIPERVAEKLYNALEAVVEPRYPVIREIKRALLEAGALGAVLSGSGPTVVGVARSESHARQIRRLLGDRWSHWSVRSLTGSALRKVERVRKPGVTSRVN
jgi:4-diphosphocytidyl-2-C-methyl-D-erythritol kinase